MSVLLFGMDPGGRLTITPSGHSRAAWLRLGIEGADVIYDDFAPVGLPWNAYGKFQQAGERPARDGWIIGAFSAARGDDLGLAIWVSGRYQEACHDMITATNTWWTRISEAGDTAIGHRIPMLAGYTGLSVHQRERDTLSALALVLAKKPELQVKLADPNRMSRLAADLARGLLARHIPREGARSETVDIVIAMHAVGLVHPFGRPLASDPRPDLAEVVARIRGRLERNPFWKGRTIDEGHIAAIAKRDYLDVERWPFDALVL